MVSTIFCQNQAYQNTPKRRRNIFFASVCWLEAKTTKARLPRSHAYQSVVRVHARVRVRVCVLWRKLIRKTFPKWKTFTSERRIVVCMWRLFQSANPLLYWVKRKRKTKGKRKGYESYRDFFFFFSQFVSFTSKLFLYRQNMYVSDRLHFGNNEEKCFFFYLHENEWKLFVSLSQNQKFVAHINANVCALRYSAKCRLLIQNVHTWTNLVKRQGYAHQHCTVIAKPNPTKLYFYLCTYKCYTHGMSVCAFFFHSLSHCFYFCIPCVITFYFNSC